MRNIIGMLFLIGTIYVLQYDGYYFGLGHRVQAETLFCDNEGCVEKHLNKKGVEHLRSIHKLKWWSHDMSDITATPIGYEYKLALKAECLDASVFVPLPENNLELYTGTGEINITGADGDD